MDRCDPEYIPSQSTVSDDSMDNEDVKEDWNPNGRWIVNESQLEKLFRFCSYCGCAIDKSYICAKSSQLKVKWECG